jgi:hypothetical protein
MKEKTLDRALADTLTAAGERPVEAVFMLKSPPKGQLRGPQTRELVHKIIGRAESKASRKADSVAIFENLQSFALRAAAPPIKELANAKEVQSAKLNRLAGEVLMRAVSKKRVAARNLKRYAK